MSARPGGGGSVDGVREATRLTRARVADVRLWGGAGLIAVAIVAGSLLLGGDEDTVAVWRASRDLSVGTEITSTVGPPPGIEVVQVSRSLAGDAYLGPGTVVEGVLRWPVATGELISTSAVAPADRVPVRLVTVPVDPLHAPVGLHAGARVDAWVTPSDTAGAPGGAPRLVLAGATVADVTDDGTGLTGDVGVVLAVPADQAGVVVAAARAGVIDLVAVPVSSQEPAGIPS